MNIDLAALKPTSVYSAQIEGTHVIVEGAFAFATEGEAPKLKQSIRTAHAEEWVTFYFSPPVVRFDLEARANPGEEQFIPHVMFCGINTFDGSAICQTEHQIRVGGRWGMGSPDNNEWRIGTVAIKNCEMWNLKVVPA